MTDSLLSSFPSSSSPGNNGWGYAYKSIDDYSQPTVINLPDEAKSFILLNITHADSMTDVVGFDFLYETYGNKDYSRPLFLNRTESENLRIQITLITSSNSSIVRNYTISNSSRGISIQPPNISSSVYTWKFHFLVFPFEFTRY